MRIWAIADLHLSFGVPNKEMDIFGPGWTNHAERLAATWHERVAPEDLVLIPGDISWALHLDEAMADLEWIHSLPGDKIMIRGNHDYWWSSPTKLRKSLPPSIQIIQNDAVVWNDVAIGGSRLWDCADVSFEGVVPLVENPVSKLPDRSEKAMQEAEKIYVRELQRLELSLKAMSKEASLSVVMTHYPPVDNKLASSRASALLEQYNIDICCFGHLHNVEPARELFGEKNGIHYHLTACDYLECTPLLIHER